MTATQAGGFDAWLDTFFASYFRRRPVNATFIGMHAYDDRLPDLSAQGQADTLGDADDLLRRLYALPPESLSASQVLDRQLAEGFLLIQRWELRSGHAGSSNPSMVTGEAIFGLVSLLLRPFAALQHRLEMATARLEAVPSFLDTAMRQMGSAPAAWIERARRECIGARLLLDDGCSRVLAETGLEHSDLQGAARSAAEAFRRFDSFLESELPRATHQYACGGEALDLLLSRGHMLEVGADGLERLALERIDEEESALRASAASGPASAPASGPASAPASGPASASGSASAPTGGSAAERTAPAELLDGGPQYLARFNALWQAARGLAVQRDLLSFPDWPLRYVERPAWARQAAPYLYFLPYRSPAPLDDTPIVDYLVPPGSDDSTIKLNHVVHHGSLGHHIQNWFAARAASRIGRIAAVDCASRIAMLCGGTMAEGWANYATDLAEDAGFLTPVERRGQHHARLRMAVRAVVDIRLHQGRLGLDEAVSMYTQRVGMSGAAAHAEAVKNSLFPGAACMYLAGWDGIWRLRREVEARERNAFSLHAFNDRVLSFGSIPVPLIARAILDSPAVPALAQS